MGFHTRRSFFVRIKICTMSEISITKLYDLISGKWGRETAENLTNFIDNKIDKVLESKFDRVLATMATKQELAETKSDLIKWMFIFWIGQAATTFGFILLFLKK
jgi:hypothetical protein